MSNTLMSNNYSDGSEAGDLSALFDGQLGPDETRFALKRLGQDAGWREACGRWQLAGDALRGNGVAPAPSGFADRVMAAVEREQQHAALTELRVKRGPVRYKPRWVGGALAASVAIAALFVARPMLDGEAPALDAPVGREIVATTPASATAPTAPERAFAAEGSVPTGAGSTDSGAAVAGVAATAVASAEGARRRSERQQRPSVARSAVSGRAQSAPEAALAAVERRGSDQVASSSASSDAGRGHPFTADAIASRPWPRAAVPGYPANAGMTVGFSGGDQGSVPISFYPFEPAILRGDSVPSAVERIPSPTPQMLPEPSAGGPIRH
ncbi:sigma-E factor negative regulatory protein [Novilysobacter antarcticus]|uniref:sigma-E factor negative regulatory protein n=1 Tax=Novilysobacter antarcticus TaxID=2862543 RepID=UPI001C993B5D|nr:sigma-E factor negative regulatory protein [Lysobacter antarcticus]